MMYDVFICCTSTELKIAERLSAYLEYYNVDCFVAHRDIPADVPWAQGIAEAIKGSKMMVALFSEDFNTGTWMDDELRTAVSANVPILTFRLSDVAFGETKAAFLKNTAFVNGVDDTEGKFPMLYEEVCNILGLPVEQALPVTEVLTERQPENTFVSQLETDRNKKTNAVSENVKKTTGGGHNLFTAVVIGVVLTLSVVLLLEWILG